MIEIYSIFFQIIVFLFIFSFPLNTKFLKSIDIGYYSIYEIFFINFSIFSTVCLFFSITNLDYNFLFYFYCIGGFLLFLIDFLKDIKKFFNFLFLIFITLNVLIFFEIASLPILQWDGLATWSIKMNNFYFGQNYSNLKNIPYSHQPHLGSYLWALFYENSYLKYEYSGRFFYVFIFLASIFSLKSNFKTKINHYLIIMLFLLIVYLSYDPYLFGGYQEYLIFSLLLFTGNFLYKILNQRKINNYQVFFFSIILNLILWTKQEGVAYVFILQIIFIFLKQPTNIQKLISTLLFTLIFIIKLKFSFNDFFDDPHFEFKNFLIFDYQLLFYKLIYITKHIFISFIKYPIWLLIILSYITIISNKKFDNKFLNIINIFAFLNFGLIYFVFLTTISNFEWLVKVTLDRMIFQTTGFYILIILICFNELYLSKKIN